MDKYEVERYYDNYYCKEFKESCLICYTLCDDGNSDCVKCNSSIQVKIKKKRKNK